MKKYLRISLFALLIAAFGTLVAFTTKGTDSKEEKAKTTEGRFFKYNAGTWSEEGSDEDCPGTEFLCGVFIPEGSEDLIEGELPIGDVEEEGLDLEGGMDANGVETEVNGLPVIFYYFNDTK